MQIMLAQCSHLTHPHKHMSANEVSECNYEFTIKKKVEKYAF